MILKLRRFLALLIDYIVIFYLMILIGYPLNKLIDLFFKDGFINMVVMDTCAILFAISIMTLFILKDIIIGYESIGKKLMKLKIYQNNNEVKDKKILIKRNLETFKFLPIYPFMILINNKSIGDNEYNTEIK